jgi:hypothetical protein
VTQLWVNAKSITINTIDRTITVTHFFTRHKTTYNLNDIDGYVIVIEVPYRGKPFSVIYLVKDEKFIQRIPSRIYSNFDEIKEGLKAAKYLGEKDFSIFKRLKILFGQKVLND